MGKNLNSFDGLIILPIISLFGFSLTVIGSISPELLFAQATYFAIGAAIFFLLSTTDAAIVKTLAWPAYIFSIFFLAATFFGSSVRGAMRWVDIGPVRLQPAELVKPALLLSSSFLLSRFPPTSWPKIIAFLGLSIVPLIMVFKQPDFGNTVIYAGTVVGLLFVCGTPTFYLFGLIVTISVLFPFIFTVLVPYQRLRLTSFLNPYMDTAGAGYNAIQAMIAIGAGQLFGRGLGRGPQSQLRFLPENHTDFIFASLTEELGLFGAALVLSSYFILFIFLLRLARTNQDSFSRFFIYGAFIQLFFQVVINVGMNLGLLPITGITLPFVSYGGSSVVSSFCTLGLCQALAKKRTDKKTIAIG